MKFKEAPGPPDCLAILVGGPSDGQRMAMTSLENEHCRFLSEGPDEAPWRQTWTVYHKTERSIEGYVVYEYQGNKVLA